MFEAFERYIVLTLKLVATVVFFLFFVQMFVVTPGRTDGKSMEPTFRDDNMFLLDRLSFFFIKPKRFDIVQFVDPTEKKFILKRVIGLPGELLMIKNGHVYVKKRGGENFFPIEESFLAPYMMTNSAHTPGAEVFNIPENTYFVLGDNRELLHDSRVRGPIPRYLITGKVISL